MCGTGKNTMKAIKRRQRGTEGHRGAFWSRGTGRNSRKGFGTVKKPCYNVRDKEHTFKKTIPIYPVTEGGHLGELQQALRGVLFSLSGRLKHGGSVRGCALCDPRKVLQCVESVKGFSSMRGNETGGQITRRVTRDGTEGHTGADEAREKQAKAKKTSVRCVLEQREEQKQRTDGTEGHF